MLTKKSFGDQVRDSFSFLVTEFGFKFRHSEELGRVETYVAESEKVRVRFFLSRGNYVNVQISVSDAQVDSAIENRFPRPEDVITIVDCLNPELGLMKSEIWKMREIHEELERKADLAKKYCSQLLAGDYAIWEQIEECLANYGEEMLKRFPNLKKLE